MPLHTTAEYWLSPKPFGVITSFHEDMWGTVQNDVSSSDLIKSRVKQGYVLASTLFGVFFSLLLSYAFSYSEDGFYLHTRNNGSLFSLANLRVKSKVKEVLIHKLLFADDAALTVHFEE